MLKMLIMLYFFLRKAKFAIKGNQIYADSDQIIVPSTKHRKISLLGELSGRQILVVIIRTSLQEQMSGNSE